MGNVWGGTLFSFVKSEMLIRYTSGDEKWMAGYRNLESRGQVRAEMRVVRV